MKFSTSLDNYNIFYEVVKYKNITKASEQMFISQPAVSQAIKKMEENLGVSLIVRSKKGIELTSIGKTIFEKVENALQTLSLIETLIDEEKQLCRGEIVIGSGSTIACKFLCSHVKDFMTDYPLVNFSFVDEVQTKMISKLKVGEISFVLTQYNEEIDFPFLYVFDSNYCFVASANCDNKKFITFAEGSFSYMLLNKFFEKYKLEGATIMQVSGYKIAVELVKLGVGIALLPRYVVQEELNNKQLIEVYSDYELPTIKYGIYYNQNLSTPAEKVFLEYLKS